MNFSLLVAFPFDVQEAHMFGTFFHTFYFIFQTNSGTVLISINPYKKLPFYTPDVIDIYRCHCLYALPPHM